MHTIVDGFLPPEPKFLKEISVRGKSVQQKADAVYRMIMDSKQLLGIEFAVVLWFWEDETAIPRLCYLYMENYWDAANTLLEITGFLRMLRCNFPICISHYTIHNKIPSRLIKWQIFESAQHLRSGLFIRL